MEIYDLKGSSVPPGIQVTAAAFAYSKSGVSLGTHGLMNSIGVVLHDPAHKQGCLSHLTLPQSDTQQKLSEYFKQCFQLMELTRVQQQQIEVVVLGGIYRDIAFVQPFLYVLKQFAIPTANCFDARSRAQTPFIGKRVLGANQAIYSPQSGAIWVSANSVGSFQYDDEARIEKRTIQNWEYLYGPALGTMD
jgi:hypothetical protein